MAFDPHLLIDRLCETFPACFNRAAPKPLKIGLGPELINLAGGVHPTLVEVTDRQIRQALKVYTEASIYQQALAQGGLRYGLDGQPAGEIKPEHQAYAARPPGERQPKQKKPPKPSTGGSSITPLNELTTLLPELIAMAISGKLDVTLKINALPQAKSASPGTMLFAVQAEGRTVLVELKNKAWNSLKTAAESYPHWVAAITGKMGEAIEGGFRLDSPAVQVFEKKAKPEATVTTPVESPAPAPVAVAAPVEPVPKIERPKLGLKGRPPTGTA